MPTGGGVPKHSNGPAGKRAAAAAAAAAAVAAPPQRPARTETVWNQKRDDVHGADYYESEDGLRTT